MVRDRRERLGQERVLTYWPLLRTSVTDAVAARLEAYKCLNVYISATQVRSQDVTYLQTHTQTQPFMV